MNSNLPDEVKVTLLTEPLFTVVLEKCLEEEFVTNFERLFGVSRPRVPRSGIEAMVDEATGFKDDQWAKFFSEFIPVVYRCVWLTWEGRFEGKGT